MNGNDAPDALVIPAQQTVLRFLENLVTGVPASSELLSDIPLERAREIVRMAGLKAGAVSAGLAIPDERSQQCGT